MKKRILSLALALVFCLGLTVPALAAEEPSTVTVEDKYGDYEVVIPGVVGQRALQLKGRGSGMVYLISDEGGMTITANMLTHSPIGYTFCSLYQWNMEKDEFDNIADYWFDEYQTMTYGSYEEESADLPNMVCCYMENVWVTFESTYKQLVAAGAFQEIKAAPWAQESLEKAFAADLFPESVDPFGEDCAQTMTCSQFAATTVNLYRAMGGSDRLSSGNPFTDVPYDYWDVGFAYNLGFVNGTSATTFSPDGTLTREQAAVMLSRVYAKLHGDIPTVTATTFADDAAVSSWAKAGVAFMADKGIVGGVGGNAFAPQQTLSIQEAVVMAQRMLENLK